MNTSITRHHLQRHKARHLLDRVCHPPSILVSSRRSERAINPKGARLDWKNCPLLPGEETILQTPQCSGQSSRPKLYLLPNGLAMAQWLKKAQTDHQSRVHTASGTSMPQPRWRGKTVSTGKHANTVNPNQFTRCTGSGPWITDAESLILRCALLSRTAGH